MVEKKEKEVIGPKSHKQLLYIQSKANITIFGGAAGSGKSHIGIIDILKYIQYPRFRACIVRRTTPQLKGPGGILDKAKLIFPLIDKKVKWKDKDGKFVFSSGAEVFLRHYEHVDSRQNFDGFEVNLFLLDEGQQFELEMANYLMSRMRNPSCPEVEPHMKITCNPLKTAYLRDWVDWYLIKEGEEAGRPDVTKDGVIRYFATVDGKMFFGESPDELFDKHGPKIKPMTMTFISANVYDNPVVCEVNKDYVNWLENLPRVERERLLHGSWDATEQNSGYFKREWVGDLVPLPPVKTQGRVRSWDIASSLPSEATPNPDWSACCLMSKDIYGEYYIEDVHRFRDRPHGVLQQILLTAEHDGRGTTIIIPADPGAAGRAYAQQIIRELTERGYYARIKITSQSKVSRFAPFAALAEAGGVRVVRAPWNEIYFAELERFDGSRNIKDDLTQFGRL